MSPSARAYRPPRRSASGPDPVVLVLVGGVEHRLRPADAMRLAAELMLAASDAEEMTS